MSKFVLDASAFLAFANREPGSEKVRPILKQAVVSAVNAAEILQKLAMKQMTIATAEGYLEQFVGEILPFDLEQAKFTAALHTKTREFGLSLGDRACLALGIKLGLTVMTADWVWPTLGLGHPIELIRSDQS